MQADSIQLKVWPNSLSSFFRNSSPRLVHPSNQNLEQRGGMLVFIAQPAEVEVQWHHWNTWGKTNRTHPVLSWTLLERADQLSSFAVSLCPCCQEELQPKEERMTKWFLDLYRCCCRFGVPAKYVQFMLKLRVGGRISKFLLV